MNEAGEVDLEDLWACASSDALRRTTDLARRVLKAPASVVCSFEAARRRVHCVADPDWIFGTDAPPDLACRDVASERAPVILSGGSGLPAAAPGTPVVAYIGVPIRLLSGRIIGVLSVLDIVQHAWTGEDLDLLNEIAAFLTSQIELRLEILHREKAEEALDATKAQLLAVADRMPGLVFERRKADAGRSTYTFFGSSKTALPAVRDMMENGEAGGFNFIHREDRDVVRAALLRSNLEETDLDLTFRVKDADRSVRWVRSQSIVRRDADGSIFWDGICFDINDLVAAREDAEAARHAKDTLLVNVNHELRTPLQAIVGFTDFLKSETQPTLVAAHARNIQSATESLLAIVEQLLAQAAGEEPLPAVASEIELRSFGETCLSMVAPAVAEKKLTSRLELDRDVPVHVLLDGQKLNQALVNLLKNAVKFTNEGGLTLRIARAANGLRFSVIDTGIGIPDSKHALVFERFARLAPADRTVEGSGLGLSITKALIEGMGGRIGVESHVGSGTTFWFEVPARFPDAEALHAIPASSTARPPEPVGARILLADDLDLNRKLIADMLGLEGYVVDCVADGAEAVKAASQRVYDLILMDMIMPGMDGVAATRAIRALPAPTCNVPIVALTANSFQEQLDGCLKAGMDATLTKPMSMDALTAAVSTWTRGRKAA